MYSDEPTKAGSPGCEMSQPTKAGSRGYEMSQSKLGLKKLSLIFTFG